MRRRRLVLVTVLVFAAIGAVVVGGGPAALRGTASASSDISARCGSSGAPAVVPITGRLFVTGDVAVAVPCVLLLQPGARVLVERARIRGSFLSISDDGPNGPTQVEIRDSELVGSHGGFVVDLRDVSDTIVVADSTLDFQAGVFIGAADVDGGGGYVQLRGSTLRSADGGSQGLVVMAGEFGGRAEVTDSTFEVPPDVPAFVFAGSCATERVTGIPPRCSP